MGPVVQRSADDYPCFGASSLAQQVGDIVLHMGAMGPWGTWVGKGYNSFYRSQQIGVLI